VNIPTCNPYGLIAGASQSSMFILCEKPFCLTLKKKIMIFLIYSPNSTNMGCDNVSLYNIKANIWAKDIGQTMILLWGVSWMHILKFILFGLIV